MGWVGHKAHIHGKRYQGEGRRDNKGVKIEETKKKGKIEPKAECIKLDFSLHFPVHNIKEIGIRRFL
jgi:hypothetical protein